MKPFAVLIGLALAIAPALACQQAQTDQDAVETAAKSDSGGHEHDEEQEEVPPLSSRADDAARDEGEKPEKVMDELGIGAGSNVADVLAGGGYYTYLLAERVGPGGTVYATGARGVKRRMEEGDLSGRTNIRVIESLAEVPAGSLDAVLINRAYHLVNQGEFFSQLHAALKPGGVVGVIEVRLGQPEGHDMKTHRMGEETVKEEMERGGFRFAGSSDILLNPDDPHTDFMEDKRHLADRMFLKFEKAEETASAGR